MNTIRCLICKKAIKGDAAMVRMSTRGRIYHERFADQVAEDVDQGWFEVGPDCNRKVLAAGSGGWT